MDASMVVHGRNILRSALSWDIMQRCVNRLLTLQDNLLVSSLQVKKSKKKRTPEEGTNRLPPTSVNNYQSMLCNIP